MSNEYPTKSTMALVDYDESDSGSETEQKPVSLLPRKTSTADKPAFKKVVDRANPHKIQVTLPDTFQGNAQQAENKDEPPTKRAKTGNSAFSGFNSLLPAPKKSTARTPGSGSKKIGLGSGVNLKTGSAPGFSREPMPTMGLSPDANEAIVNGSVENSENSTWDEPGDSTTAPELEKSMSPPKVEVRTQGNLMMFRPLSVARKPKKKKPAQSNSSDILMATNSDGAEKTVTAPKVSLFSMEAATETTLAPSISDGYQPLIYSNPEVDAINGDDAPQIESPPIAPEFPTHRPPPRPPHQDPQSLSTIASDLNLSASARRQLLGRHHASDATINIVNFNTDKEYAANELLRQAGEQVQHNPVRAIAPGKHSLKQLVNAASTQKDALEEHFATGKRNKKEAGSKYGW